MLGNLGVRAATRLFVLGSMLGLGMRAHVMRTMGDGLVRLVRYSRVRLMTGHVDVSLGEQAKENQSGAGCYHGSNQGFISLKDSSAAKR